MSAFKGIAAVLAAAWLWGCGTYVPEIQDFGDSVEGQRLVQAIIFNITCELRDAVTDLREENPQGTFLDSWGIQTTLSLTIDEKGAIAPSVLWTPPSPASAVFSLAAGVNFSADATRTDRINAYYLISDLQQARCSEASRPHGLFLLQSDLKLSQWLRTAVSAQITNSINFKTTSLAVKTNVIQHEVKFEVVTSGTANPSWTLKRVAIDPSGNLLSAGRTRTHDLLITLAPADRAVLTEVTKHGPRRVTVATSPSPQAAELHFSALISQGLGTTARSALQP